MMSAQRLGNPAWLWPEIIPYFDPRGVHPHDIPSVGVFDEPVVQVCINSRWASHLTAGIERFTYRDAWRGTESEIDNAIEAVRQVLAALDAAEGKCTLNCCCNQPPPLTRITSDGVFQSSSDGGTTWVNDPARDTRNQAPQLPPVTGDFALTKRKAANNVVAYLELAKSQMSAQLATDSSVAAITTIITGILLLLGIITLGATAVILAAMTMAVVGLTSTAFNADFTEAKWQSMTELLFCNMETNGRLIAGKYPAVVSGAASIFGDLGNPGGRWLNGLLQALGEGGINNAAATASANNRSCDAAQCSFVWEWDLTQAADNIVMSHPVGHTRGHYQAGLGWIADYYSADDIRIADLKFNWGKAYHITAIDFVTTTVDSSFPCDIKFRENTASLTGFGTPNGESVDTYNWGNVTPGYPLDDPASSLPDIFLCDCFAGTQAQSRSLTLHKIRLHSTDKMSFPTGHAV